MLVASSQLIIKLGAESGALNFTKLTVYISSLPMLYKIPSAAIPCHMLPMNDGIPENG